VYRPSGKAQLPAIVFFHGGGWVLGDLETQDLLCARIADEAKCVVVSADYRLAPEHPFPAAVDDALAVFRWTVAGAERLGIDPARIAVAGSSAGGCLAAVVAQELPGESAPCFQLLLCPVTNISTEAASYDLFADGFGLTAAGMRWFIDHYAPEPALRLDPRASPLLAAELSAVPDACVVVAGFDPLRDEGLAYAERLREAGVAVELILEPSAIHGFVGLAGLLDVSERALQSACGALRRAFSKR
jgi:acetyl esterase